MLKPSATPGPNPTPRRSRPAPADTLTLPPLLVAAPSDGPVHHVRAALDKRLRVLLARERGVRSGEDITDLHKMRVSIRRMRAMLRAARPLLDAAWADALRAELGWLGGALGPVRDLDVMLERLRGEIATLPASEQDAGRVLLGAVEAKRAEARVAMIAALDAPRYPALLERVADAVRLPLPTPSATRDQPPIEDLVRAEAKRLRRAVTKAGQDPPDAVLHDLRIDGKRVRYVGELAAPALRGTVTGRTVRRLLVATECLQDRLGAHQDACVAEERIRALVDELTRPGCAADARVAFVGGRLAERERARADAARAGWWTAWEQVEQLIRAL